MQQIHGKDYPLVSIFSFVKNGVRSIKRSVDSLLGQDYPNLQIIIQDGQSTDGTLEILREYGDSIELVSEPDDGPGQAYYRALSRIRGDFFGSCLADEELLPNAVSWAVDYLRSKPELAAIYGDTYSTDIDGNVKSKIIPPEYDFTKLICVELVPPFLAGFFRTSCFRQIQLHQPMEENADYEIWAKLGMKFPIEHVSVILAKNAHHVGANSYRSLSYPSQVASKRRIMDRIFDDPDTPADVRKLRYRAYAGLHLWAATAIISRCGDMDTGKAHFLKALQYEPDENMGKYAAKKLYVHGIGLCESGRMQEGLECMQIPIDANMIYPGFYYNIANALYALGRFDEAREAVEKELEIQPGKSEVIELLNDLNNRSKSTVEPRFEKGYGIDISGNCGDGEYGDDTRISDSDRQKFKSWIDMFADAEDRLYYRDQTPQSLMTFVKWVEQYKPTKIVEMGTLSGMSLRTWLAASDEVKVAAIDLSFEPLRQSKELLDVDLSRVELVEQDILTVDFGRLWSPEDKVLLYVDAHDLVNVPIMKYVLKNALGSLPPGSVVAVDDLWYCADEVCEESLTKFFEEVTTSCVDSLLCFDGHYAPYWKGGFFIGFREVVPLMEWVNRNKVQLVFDPGAKAVLFEYTDDIETRTDGEFDAKQFQQLCGCMYYNPAGIAKVTETNDLSAAGKASSLCNKAAANYARGQVHDTLTCFESAKNLTGNISGLAFATAACFARYKRFDLAIKILDSEIETGSADARSVTLYNDIKAHIARIQPELQVCQKDSKEGITIFTVPKPFAGHIGTIQRNAIKSWLQLNTNVEIIMFGNEDGMSEFAGEVGIKHVPDIQLNEYGTPLVNDIFQKAQQMASYDIMAYINTDMIMMDDFVEATQKTSQKFENFLVVGQRWDVDITESLEFSCGWQKNLLNHTWANGKLHAVTGIDYFIFNRPFWQNMPGFAIGRTAWDNWMVYEALVRRRALIDATKVIAAIHQNHDYSHVAGSSANSWDGPETRLNRAMAGQNAAMAGNAANAHWVLTSDGFQEQLEMREFEESKDYFEQAALTLCNEAVGLLKDGKSTKALPVLDEAVNMIEGVPVIHYLRAVTLTQLSRAAEARAEANKVLKVDPGHAGAKKILSMTKSMVTPCEGTLDSPQFDPLNELPCLDQQTADFYEIDISDERMSETDRELGNLLNYGIRHFREDRPVEALLCLDEACLINDKVQGIHYLRGVALVRLGRFEESRWACEAQLSFQPDHEKSQQLLNQLTESMAGAEVANLEEAVNYSIEPV